MHPLFYPNSIAVVGASANNNKPGGMVLLSLLKNGYAGGIYPVNPEHDTIAGLPCYSSPADIPAPVDLAVIAVATPLIQDAIRACAAKKIKAVIIFTSGFAEMGEAGAARQKELALLAQENHIALCGPNCMGVFNSKNAMSAGFVISELAGKISGPNFFGFISQSGGFGAIMHAAASDRGLGFTYFICSGNEADLQFADYLAYMTADPQTRVIAGYLEGVKDGRKLLQAAEMALEARKPIILIKTGRYPAAAQAASSHTGALAGSDQVYTSFFKQKGIIRAEGVEELSTMLSILSHGNLLQGNKVGLLVGSGGNGVLLADKCIEVGLEVGELTSSTKEALTKLLPSFATATNPIDLTSRIFSDTNLLKEACVLLLKDPSIDMLIIMHWASREAGYYQPTREIVDLLAGSTKPLLLLIWGADEAVIDDLNFFRAHGIAAVREIDFAARSLAALAKYSAKVHSHTGSAPTPLPPLPNREKADLLLKKYPSGTILSEGQAREIISTCGIPITRGGLATSPEEAVNIAAALACPVALKIDSPDLPHKTEVGGVKLHLDKPKKIKQAYNDITANAKKNRPEARINGILVQEMLTGGLEAIAGIHREPVFGPTVLFGLGGIWVEALADVSLRIAPLSREDAAEMIEELKGARVLTGFRGQSPVDREAVIKLLLKLSQIALAFPHLATLDLNPLFLYPQGQGIRAADALITIE